MNYLLIVHAIFGASALFSGLIAIISAKGKKLHRKTGKVYFIAMTAVFISGIIMASVKENRFLLLIAFLSYYSVFSGVRILKLKDLHKNQRPQWFDWAAGIINTIANLIFTGMGLNYLFIDDNVGGASLSIGFGLVGLWISYANLKPFIIKPEKASHWYASHIGNMMGGYIATSTAFLSTIVTRYDLMNPLAAFSLPSLIGIPLLIYWTNKVSK